MMIRNLLLVLVTLSLSFSAVQAQEMSWRKHRKLAEQLEEEALARNIMDKIKMIGLKSGEISKNITTYQLHYHILVYAVDYINFTRKNIFGEQEITMVDVKKITENILKILK